MIKNIVTIALIIFVVAIIAILGGAVFSKQPAQQANTQNLVNQSTTKTILNAELAKHNNQNDCWMVVDGKVYNATSYIFQHPGGPGQIISYCGKDASQVFDSIHSSRARNILTTFYVGNFGG